MKYYCTYLTIYKGNKFPMFYIGSSTVEKVQNGYHGSISSIYKEVYNKEIKRNPHLFKTLILKIFNHKKESLRHEIKLQTALQVLKKPTIYLNRNIANIHFIKTRTKHSEETKRKISESNKGKIGWNKGIPNPKQSDRMKENNPNKGRNFKERHHHFKKGRVPHNLTPLYSFACKQCNAQVVQRISNKKNRSLFCDKSCAVKYRNINNHWTRNQRSQLPPAEQANS